MNKRGKTGGFLLLETMIGVAVFAIGVLGLARCVENCLTAEYALTIDQRARLALENRMAEIEAGAVDTEKSSETKLSGMFSGITLKQSRRPVRINDEKKVPIGGMYEVTVDAIWRSGEETQSKTLTLYVYRQ